MNKSISFWGEEQAGNNKVHANVSQIILPVFWKEFKGPSEVCASAWGCGQGYNSIYAPSQQAVTCSLAKGSGHCHHSCEVQIVRVAMAGHANLSHPYCAKSHHTKPLFPPFVDNLHSHHLLGQPSSDEHLLFSCRSVCCPCAYHWASQETLGRHLGVFIWQCVSLMDCFSFLDLVW